MFQRISAFRFISLQKNTLNALFILQFVSNFVRQQSGAATDLQFSTKLSRKNENAALHSLNGTKATEHLLVRFSCKMGTGGSRRG